MSPASSQRQWVKNNVVCSERRGARRRQLGARASRTHPHPHTHKTLTHTHSTMAAALYGFFFLFYGDLTHGLNIPINVSIHKQK